MDIERLVQRSVGAERMDLFARGRHRARTKGHVFIGDVGCVINMEDVAAFRNEEKVKPAVRASTVVVSISVLSSASSSCTLPRVKT
jgi:hypothetical protein